MFNKISEGIIKQKGIILFVIAILFAVSVVGTVFLVLDKDKINSDVASYLEEDSQTAQGIQFLKDEFDIRGYATFVVRVDENADGVTKLFDKISRLKQNERITSVTWYGTFDEVDKMGDSLDNLIDIVNNEENRALIETVLDKVKASDLAVQSYGDTIEQVERLLSFATEENKDIVDTSSLRAYLRQSTQTEGVYDYVLLFMLKTDGVADDSYELLDAIKSEFSDTSYASSGSIETGQRLLQDTMEDLPWFIVSGVIVVLLILFLTTASFLEPVIMLITLAVGIVISMGINYLFPSISIISFAISAVLQLAITMDYAVFYTHLYRRERKELPALDATKKALPETMENVLASGLTTVGGFAGLYCMHFGIGTDIANVLIKGIVLSMLTVLTVQPVLTLVLDKQIGASTHHFIEKIIKNGKKPTKGMIAKPVATLSVKMRIVLAVLAVALLVPCYLGQSNLTYSYLQLYEKNNETEEEILSEQIGNQLILAVPYDISAKGKTHADYVNAIREKSRGRIGSIMSMFTVLDTDEKNIDYVLNQSTNWEELFSDWKASQSGNTVDLSSLSLLNEEITQEETEQLAEIVQSMLPYVEQIDANLSATSAYLTETTEGKRYTLYAISFNGDSEDEEAQEVFSDIMKVTDSYFGKNNAYGIGLVISGYEMAQVTPKDFLRVTLVSIAIIFVIVAVLLRNPLKSLIAVVIIELGIWLNLSISYLAGESVNFIVYLIISSVELGCTVDYAILFANTFEKNRKNCTTGKECAVLSATQSMPAIIVSALMISCVCLGMYFIGSNLIIRQLAGILARGAAISFILVAVLMTGVWSFFPVKKKEKNYKNKIDEINKKLNEEQSL